MSQNFSGNKSNIRQFTPEELSQYNGREGVAVLVAYKGRIYDLTGSFLWKSGRHQATHQAGSDLTASMMDAPHGEEMLGKFPVVGQLVRPWPADEVIINRPRPGA